jgi:hypothetical protein
MIFLSAETPRLFQVWIAIEEEELVAGHFYIKGGRRVKPILLAKMRF